MKRLFIGGEYFYSPTIFFRKDVFNLEEYLKMRFPTKFYSYTGGGLFSIKNILKEINLGTDDVVLLPSYLCPTILIPFKRLGVNYDYYRIDSSFQIDIDFVKKKLNKNIKCVFFINYFGFPPNLKIGTFLKELQKTGIIIIEDAVQSFFSSFDNIGDYIFNSFRKFFPADGSVIISKNQKKDGKGMYIKYFIEKFKGQLLRYLYFDAGLNTENKALKYLNNAKNLYYTYQYAHFSSFNKFLLKKTNVLEKNIIRRENYKYLLNLYKEKSIFKQLPQDVVPLGFPILLDNRDKKRSELIRENIFCPIHWHIPEEVDTCLYSDSHEISKHILTIPLNENFNRPEMSELLSKLHKTIL